MFFNGAGAPGDMKYLLWRTKAFALFAQTHFFKFYLSTKYFIQIE